MPKKLKLFTSEAANGGNSNCKADVMSWNIEAVGRWLEASGFAEYKDSFQLHRIDGLSLLLLKEDDLKQELQIKILGDVKKIIYAVSKLNEGSHEALCPSPAHSVCYHSPRNQNLTPTKHLPSLTDLKKNRTFSSNSLTDSQDKLGNLRGVGRSLPPEYFKTVVSCVYMFLVTWITAIVMVLVHDRVPDKKVHPPLPDIFLDNVPLIPWAFQLCEITILLLSITWLGILYFHKHRSILIRRFSALSGSVFLLRCATMFITSLSVPGDHLQCAPRTDSDFWTKVQMASVIWTGAGLSIKGVRTCGDYMFSGHTTALTILNFFITEYTPRRVYFLHIASWVLNTFGIFFILAAHEHYSIDVFIAFYITSRMFLYYHSLANNRALHQRDSFRTRIWFPMFGYFEAHIDGIVPNEYTNPLSTKNIKWFGDVILWSLIKLRYLVAHIPPLDKKIY